MLVNNTEGVGTIPKLSSYLAVATQVVYYGGPSQTPMVA